MNILNKVLDILIENKILFIAIVLIIIFFILKLESFVAVVISILIILFSDKIKIYINKFTSWLR